MKGMRWVCAALMWLAAAGSLWADEGMWVLKELNKQNRERIKELGFVQALIRNLTIKASIMLAKMHMTL